MTKNEIEAKILKLVNDNVNFTPFLLRMEFDTRDHKKVNTAVETLTKAGKIHMGPNYTFISGPKPVEG